METLSNNVHTVRAVTISWQTDQKKMNANYFDIQ